jgi:hypothetical protein
VKNDCQRCAQRSNHAEQEERSIDERRAAETCPRRSDRLFAQVNANLHFAPRSPLRTSPPQREANLGSPFPVLNVVDYRRLSSFCKL